MGFLAPLAEIGDQLLPDTPLDADQDPTEQ